ncbi:MAG TPA: LPXTG cell wall anchor domain-containing protein [Acidimicrobiales bacterium]|nr:LPXTG cell wall anchor domain-containing protein [Acidimicrobiales bacterium]
MIRRALTVAVAAATMLAVAGAAQAQPYPPLAPTITLSSTVVVRGETVTVGGAGFAASSTVTITFFSHPVVLGSTTTDGNGGFSTSVTIPSDAKLGTHTMTAHGTAADGRPASASTTLTVVAGTAGISGGGGAPGVAAEEVAFDELLEGAGVGTFEREAEGGLPRTGGDSVPLARIGAALLAVGGGLLFVTRRRRVSAAA